LLPERDGPATFSPLPPDSGDESPVDPDDATTGFDPARSSSSPFATPLGPATVAPPPFPAGPVAFPEEAEAPVFCTAATDTWPTTGATKGLSARLDS